MPVAPCDCWNETLKLSLLLPIANQALDDDTPEERSEYLLTVTSATPGLEVSPTAREVKIIMAASDNPHGQFSFSQPQMRVSEEQRTVRLHSPAKVVQNCEIKAEVEIIFTFCSLVKVQNVKNTLVKVKVHIQLINSTDNNKVLDLKYILVTICSFAINATIMNIILQKSKSEQNP